MKRFLLLSVSCVFLFSIVASPAMAISQFRKAFDETYVKESGNEEFMAAFKKASCNTCHIKGEKKDQRNAYGDALAGLIEGDANQRIKDAGKEGGIQGRKAEIEVVLAELAEAFKKVEKEESPSGETYGDRLSAGKLPVELPEEEE